LIHRDPIRETGSAEPCSASALRKKMPGIAGHFVQGVTTNGRHPP